MQINGTAVEAALGEMVKKGQIEKIGNVRSTKYIRNKE